MAVLGPPRKTFVLAAELCAWQPRLVLFEDADDLFLAIPAPSHVRLLPLDSTQIEGIFGGKVTPQNWIWDPVQAKPSFILMNLWAIGPTMVIFLAGLQSVPETMYEAASIDGANALHRFRHITLPMMSPIIFFNLIVGIIGSFQIFNSAFVMTQGGPGNATLFYVLYLYRQAWELFHFGYASALAWILFVIVLIFTLIQFRLARRWVFYEGDIKT